MQSASNSSRINPTKTSDFLTLWMFVISKEYVLKINVCNTLLIKKQIKENKNSDTSKNNNNKKINAKM